jgi:uncharacterized coiled-coil protein SlyX
MKTSIPPILITFALVCFALLPRAQAVSPAPDGGYPGGNTAEGTDALLNLNSGIWNSGFGLEALNHNTAGKDNTAMGVRALFSDTSGSNNSATGVYALYSNINGWYNNAVGAYALANNISGNYNTANGYGALYRNTADYNTATGFAALYHNTTGSFNTANGYQALNSNTDGSGNTANGSQALFFNTGEANTAIGDSALLFNTTGSNNTALGIVAGNNVSTANNVICIGSGVEGANVSNTCFIGNIRGVTTGNADAIPVLIDSAGQLGTISSSRRFKKEIKPMDSASEAILSLKPVTFHYKSDASGTPQFGLIAEEVAEINPDLVVRDDNGEIYTVRYDAVNAMLLNEFLKEHRKVEEQQATITELRSTVAQQQKDLQATAAHQQKQIEALTAGLQKVNAQLEVNKTAPQIVLNNQ